jgi:hypothetical protein
MKKSFYMTVFFILILMISGCTSWQKNYGKLKIVPKGQNEVTLQALIDKWEDYNIYYAGRDDRFPLGVIFDPKNSATSLQGDRWKNVEDREMLLKILDRIERNINYIPLLREILGPDGRFYGYLYHSFGPVVFKRIDDKKMYVFDLEDPDDRDDPAMVRP